MAERAVAAIDRGEIVGAGRQKWGSQGETAAGEGPGSLRSVVPS